MLSFTTLHISLGASVVQLLSVHLGIRAVRSVRSFYLLCLGACKMPVCFGHSVAQERGTEQLWLADRCADTVPGCVCALCGYGCTYMGGYGGTCSSCHRSCCWKMSHKCKMFLSCSFLLRDRRTGDNVPS